MKVHIKRVDNAFHLESTNEDGLKVYTDASPGIGGHNKAFRPMQLVLAALGSCSSIDVIYLLNKQRQALKHLEVEVDGQRAEGEIPAVFTDIHLKYILYGELNEKKVERACRLSMEKLCSVSKMLEQAVKISWSYEIREQG
ncbi:MAG: OsmC family peroxiredoxin [Bacteroidetes bacterium]|nr:MAG: OsmC family peroxiredoxin [Bacteroidota bacterium]